MKIVVRQIITNVYDGSIKIKFIVFDNKQRAEGEAEYVRDIGWSWSAHSEIWNLDQEIKAARWGFRYFPRYDEYQPKDELEFRLELFYAIRELRTRYYDSKSSKNLSHHHLRNPASTTS